MAKGLRAAGHTLRTSSTTGSATLKTRNPGSHCGGGSSPGFGRHRLRGHPCRAGGSVAVRDPVPTSGPVPTRPAGHGLPGQSPGRGGRPPARGGRGDRRPAGPPSADPGARSAGARRNLSMIIDLPLLSGSSSSRFGIRCRSGHASSASSLPGPRWRVYSRSTGPPAHPPAAQRPAAWRPAERLRADATDPLPRRAHRVHGRAPASPLLDHLERLGHHRGRQSIVVGRRNRYGGRGRAGWRLAPAFQVPAGRPGPSVLAAASSVICRVCSTIANKAFSSTCPRLCSRRRSVAAFCSHALIGREVRAPPASSCRSAAR